MSFLSEELEKQFKAANTNPFNLSTRTNGISVSQLYKWTNGEQTSISLKDLTTLANALSDDQVQHAKLVVAHLMDERFGPGHELVRIEMDQPSEFKDRPKYQSRGEEALAYIGELRMKSPDTNELVIRLARSLGAKI